ncbi:MAG: ATP-binding cassette domain-containing protein [Mariprofundaceae bacterium]|nr:ATP-binding cassette domain-containing protein [Mariprofundaceae bacterium]
MTVPAIRLNHLSFGRPEARILENIDLQLEAGHFLGIVGPNGAGKSTLLHIICGLLQADDGHIDLFGECLSRSSRKRLLSQLRFLPQRQEGMSSMPVRVRHVVAMGLDSAYGPLWRRAPHHEKINQALERTGIMAYADTDFRALSGGQQQRVRLARALVAMPRILLLDEPAAALDAPAQAKLYKLLRQLCDELDMAIVMVEHDIAAISDYVDSVACLNRSIHHHALRGETIPEQIWHDMYGNHMHIVAHDAACIGCESHDDEPHDERDT